MGKIVYSLGPSREVGPLCKNGHERAVYERRYARTGMAPTRHCSACHADQGKQRRQIAARVPSPSHFWKTAPERRLEDIASWAEFCRTIVHRIDMERFHDRVAERGRAS